MQSHLEATLIYVIVTLHLLRWASRHWCILPPFWARLRTTQLTLRRVSILEPRQRVWVMWPEQWASKTAIKTLWSVRSAYYFYNSVLCTPSPWKSLRMLALLHLVQRCRHINTEELLAEYMGQKYSDIQGLDRSRETISCPRLGLPSWVWKKKRK